MMEANEFQVGVQFVNGKTREHPRERGVTQTVIKITSDNTVITDLTDFGAAAPYARECSLVYTPDTQNLFESYYTL